MVSRLAAFVIWAAVAASAVFWALRLLDRPAPVPAHATLVVPAAVVNGDLARLFGSDPLPAAGVAVAAAPAADARFRLLGVVAPRSAAASGEGLALIALDGKPAKPYRIGAAVDGELVLQTVHARGAALGPRGQAAQLALELPALPPPSTGVPGAGDAAARALAPAAPPGARVMPLRPPGPPVAVPAPVPPTVPAAPAAPEAPPFERPPPEAAERPMVAPPTSAGRPPL